jgi:hypothetical protein
MNRVWRHRTLLIWLAPVIVLAMLWATDPDGGASTKIWLLRGATAIMVVSFTHWIRRAWLDYPEADVQALLREARKSPTGAGLAFIGIAIILSALLGLIGGNARAADVRTYIAPQATPYLPVLRAERERFWPSHPKPELLAALIEHESGCFALKTKCWNPKSRLKSAREEGAGFGQITRAYRGDGSLRFDALAEIRGRHPVLAEWSWENVYGRPDLQLRAVVLKSLDDFKALRMVVDPLERLRFADAAYNGGMGGVQNERRACATAAGCDPQRWHGHVERFCLKSKAALYGSRSACDINRHHVHDVFVRAPKYAGMV